MAWFALGPREVYVPSYHTSPVYLNRINVTNTVIVNNRRHQHQRHECDLRESRQRRAPSWRCSRPHLRARGRCNRRRLWFGRKRCDRPLWWPRPRLLPTRASVSCESAPPGARVLQPPAALQSRAVIAKRTPPPAARAVRQKTAGPGGEWRPSAGYHSGTADPAEPAAAGAALGAASAGSTPTAAPRHRRCKANRPAATAHRRRPRTAAAPRRLQLPHRGPTPRRRPSRQCRACGAPTGSRLRPVNPAPASTTPGTPPSPAPEPRRAQRDKLPAPNQARAGAQEGKREEGRRKEGRRKTRKNDK